MTPKTPHSTFDTVLRTILSVPQLEAELKAAKEEARREKRLAAMGFENILAATRGHATHEETTPSPYLDALRAVKALYRYAATCSELEDLKSRLRDAEQTELAGLITRFVCENIDPLIGSAPELVPPAYQTVRRLKGECEFYREQYRELQRELAASQARESTTLRERDAARTELDELKVYLNKLGGA